LFLSFKKTAFLANLHLEQRRDSTQLNPAPNHCAKFH